MKILVVEDNAIHQEAARAQLSKGNDLTVVDKYEEAEKLIQDMSFDAVLVDLMLPASGRALRPEAKNLFAGKEMPIGIFLALLAAKNGAKFIAVLSDSSHHDHPASAALDFFNQEGCENPTIMMVGEAKMILTNNQSWLGCFKKSNMAKDVGWKKKHDVFAKNWGKLLQCLINSK